MNKEIYRLEILWDQLKYFHLRLLRKPSLVNVKNEI